MLVDEMVPRLLPKSRRDDMLVDEMVPRLLPKSRRDDMLVDEMLPRLLPKSRRDDMLVANENIQHHLPRPVRDGMLVENDYTSPPPVPLGTECEKASLISNISSPTGLAKHSKKVVMYNFQPLIRMNKKYQIM
jgi:hypothetical protein